MNATMWGLPTSAVVLTMVVVLMGAFFQATVGFGFALLAVPLLALSLSPRTAVVIVFFHSTVASGLTAQRLRRDIAWTEVRQLSLGAMAGMPLGVVVLLTASATTLRFAVGVVTCAAAVWLVLPSTKRRTPTSARPLLTVGVGAVSGVLNTSLSTNGPPLVMYLRARGVEAATFRSTLSAVFTISNVVGLGLLLASGAVHGDAVRYFVLSVALLGAGWLAGNALATRLRNPQFTRLVDALLFVSGALAIVRAVTA